MVSFEYHIIQEGRTDGLLQELRQGNGMDK